MSHQKTHSRSRGYGSQSIYGHSEGIELNQGYAEPFGAGVEVKSEGIKNPFVKMEALNVQVGDGEAKRGILILMVGTLPVLVALPCMFLSGGLSYGHGTYDMGTSVSVVSILVMLAGVFMLVTHMLVRGNIISLTSEARGRDGVSTGEFVGAIAMVVCSDALAFRESPRGAISRVVCQSVQLVYGNSACVGRVLEFKHGEYGEHGGRIRRGGGFVQNIV